MLEATLRYIAETYKTIRERGYTLESKYFYGPPFVPNYDKLAAERFLARFDSSVIRELKRRGWILVKGTDSKIDKIVQEKLDA